MLQSMVEVALKALQGLLHSLEGRQGQNPEDQVRMANGCVLVLVEALQWEFLEGVSDASLALRSLEGDGGEGGDEEDGGVIKEGYTAVKPGQAWTDLLVRSGLVGLLCQAYNCLRGVCAGLPRGAGLWESSGRGLRQSLIQLASLQGHVFSRPNVQGVQETDLPLQREYLSHLLQGATMMCATEIARGEAGVEEDGGGAMLDVCQLYQRVHPSHI
jgi:hypothetical protein